MRIITGSARGCRLKTPQGQETTRPTADRVKESVFNILGSMVQDRRVLDLFAGTGNLGLEALSRGAAAAVFADRTTADLIRENARRTRLEDRVQVLSGDVFAILRRLEAQGERFSLILWQQALAAIDAGNLLAEDGILIVEHGADEDILPALTHLERREHRRYGHTTQVSFFQWRDYAGAEEEEP